MIRRATAADLPDLLKIGREFFEESGWPELCAWDEASVTRTFTSLIEGEMPGGLLVAFQGEMVGMAAFVLYPFYFNAECTVGQEIFWYARPMFRNGIGAALLEAMEHEARTAGALAFMMANIAGHRDEALARLYARRGYKPAENTFLKRL